MARHDKKLSARTVATLSKPGMHGDGGGLYLRVTPTGSRQWVFVYFLGGKRKEMGLGGLGDTTLSQARDKRDAARAKVAVGERPNAAPAEVRAAKLDTFGEVALDLIANIEDGFKNPKHRQQWRNSLTEHAKPIWDTPVDKVDTEAVLKVLKPIWTKVPETADRLRGRIERVLDAARVKGRITGPWENPARWRGHLSVVLQEKKTMTRGHHEAMPYALVPAFLAGLRLRPGLAARMLELTVLTAVRSNEAFNARRREVDLAEKVWTIPAERMKAGKEHRVPLVGRALEIMVEVCADSTRPDDYLFPGAKPGKPLSNMAMEMQMRRMGYGDLMKTTRVKGEVVKTVIPAKHPGYTVHGFRSSFRDWAGDNTDTPEEIVEAALAHVVGSKVRQAYRRGDALEKRRALMADWDYFVGGGALARGLSGTPK